uniref:Peptidylprolyl isomerase like 4 n=1 Tax=Oncorhynchus mykiss TaxID=8022 RepID=A0A8C7US03_ONCMY
MAVLLETTFGDIVIDLFTERPKSKKTCTNVNVCKLYGDQASLFDASSLIYHSLSYAVTISLPPQFLITTGEVHTVFGEVSEGIGVLDKLNDTFVDKVFIPFQDIRINHTVILEDPLDDPADLPVPNRSPEPTKEQLDSGRIGAEEVINDTDGEEAEELDELLKEEAAKTQAILLEMVGNLPDAEVKPPENVLFVCKLNPMTIEEDLEILFSRFGLSPCLFQHTDLKSGESLCYAFIEFENNMFGFHLISICTMS